MDCRLFAADTTSAESHHRFIIERIAVRFNYGRKFGEFGDPVIDGVVKAADTHFKIITRIDHDDMLAMSS